jgi:CRISPR-associated endonuclease/helicase Cas3
VRANHNLLWGKWGDNGTDRYELLAHLLDTAAAMDAIISQWLPRTLLGRLSELVGADAAHVLRSAAALHDIAKATPYFQGQLLSPRAESFGQHVDELRQAGFIFPDPHSTSGEERRLLARHEIGAAALLTGDLTLDTGPAGVAHIVAGHHGRWHIPGEHSIYEHPGVCRYYRELTTEGAWADAIADLRDILTVTTGADSTLTVAQPAVVAILTPLVCLADWLASEHTNLNRGRLHLDKLRDDPGAFHQARLAEFTKSVPRLLGAPHKPKGTFREVFGFAPTRPVQHALVTEHEPRLTIAMVPMGEGKTEAALGSWLASAGERQGLFFALPTMSTADAMFSRVQAMFETVESDVLGTLSHGRAILNSFYAPVPEDTRVVTQERDGGLVPGDWFTGRHRALLAPVAVGTVDQLLSGVLRHRYGFMRIAAAAGKTVVLDEVHSYDPYMSELVCRLLEWLGWLHTDVVLLSATLPKRRLERYVNAYAKGRGVAVSDLEQVPYPAIVTVGEQGTTVLDLTEELSGREATIELEYRLGGDMITSAEAEVRRLRNLYPEAKVGVIVNTVRAAQDLASRTVDLCPMLLHSRLPASERARRVDEAIHQFGKHADPGAGLLIATQVVEQSIDVDFDVLVSELCPAASLLQRMGRTWRHPRDRPVGLGSATCIILAPTSLGQSPMAFLPYSAAEIHATWERALDGGARTTVAIPGDVQSLVDVADVGFEDLAGERRALVERHLVAGATMVNAALGALIPTPEQINRDLRRLSAMTSGDLGNEETATRWSALPSVVVLPTSATNPAAWNGPLPPRPTRNQVVDLLGHTIPVSGSLAGRLLALAQTENTVQTGTWDHRLLHDLLVVDLDGSPWLVLDAELGLYTERTN